MGEECQHGFSRLERQKEISYSCEGEIKILIKDICEECNEVLGEEIHVFKFSHIEYL